MSGTRPTYPRPASWSPICLIVSRAPPASGKMITPGRGPSPSGTCSVPGQAPSGAGIWTSRRGIGPPPGSSGPVARNVPSANFQMSGSCPQFVDREQTPAASSVAREVRRGPGEERHWMTEGSDDRGLAMSEERDEGRQQARKPPRAPLRQKSRRRWAIAGGVAASWVVLEMLTGSVVSATVVLVVIAVLGAVTVGGLRVLGVTRDHPWIQRVASRPWRDGEDVLKVAMRHLHDVFVITPSGSLLAPGLVELELNPDDLASLCERMELGVISESMSEVYEEQVTAYRARLTGAGRPSVYVTASGSVPPGRYRLRQGDPVGARPPEFAYAAAPPAFVGSGGTWYEQVPAVNELGPAAGGGMTTIMAESLPPALRLVTGSSVAETRVPGARAGR